MYGRKLKGDKLDPKIDFYESIENRSKLTLNTLPSIHASTDEMGKYRIKNSQRARVLSSEFQTFKLSEDQNMLKNALLSKEHSTQRIIDSFKSKNELLIKKEKNIGNNHRNHGDKLFIPKRRGAKPGLLSKLGKRISTIGTIGGMFETFEKEKEEHKRSISLSDIVDDNDEYAKFLQDNERVSKYPSSATVTTGSKSFVPLPKPQLELEQTCRDIESPTCNQIVYSKDNQLYINFPNESTGSLVSKLLDTYSKFHLNDQNYEIPDNLPATVADSSNSYYGSSKITAETDLFSSVEAKSFYSKNSSHGLNDSNSQFNIQIPLVTKNYNKELPSLPTPTTPFSDRSINQFTLRDYDDSSNPQITDDSIPPELPKHKTFPNYLLNTPETAYYDCHETLSTTNNSLATISLSPISSTEPIVKRLVEIPKDTTIFTRKSRKNYGNIQKFENSNSNDAGKERSASFQYLKNVGIDPFMLTGYQENTQLKVMNL